MCLIMQDGADAQIVLLSQHHFLPLDPTKAKAVGKYDMAHRDLQERRRNKID